MAFVNDSNPVLLEPDFDVEIRQLCAEVVGADATDLILKEKLNKEDGLLMDGSLIQIFACSGCSISFSSAYYATAKLIYKSSEVSSNMLDRTR